jgi:hypothetical protein
MAKQNGPSQAEVAQYNMMARQLIVDSGLKRTQLLTSGSFNPATQPVVQFPPRNVGLILGFLVQVTANVAVAGGGTPLTLTPYGAANLLSQIRYDDLSNNTRIQTTGSHINAINSVRGGIPYLAVDALANVGGAAYPVSYGSWYPTLVQAAATIAAGANSDVAMTYFVPLAYSDQDLRGAVFCNVVNATQNLQFTLNANAVGARTPSNWFGGVYCTADAVTPPAGVTTSNFTIYIWQVYYDQLPTGPNGYILPVLDIQTIYDIKNTSMAAPTANQNYPIPYSNYRDFLATVVTYVNRVTTAGAFALESDFSFVALQAANYTEMFNVPIRVAATWSRATIGLDFPRGAIYIPSRSRPVATIQYGNIDVVLNVTDVQAGAFVGVWYEAFSLQNVVPQAGSLPGGVA